MKKSLLIALASLTVGGGAAHAQIDYLGNHLESMRYDNLRRHQQEMLRGKSKKRSKKAPARRVTRPHKEAGLSLARLRVGDRIGAIHSTKSNVVFKGNGARIASRVPLTLNVEGRGVSDMPRGKKAPVGDFAYITSTGRKSGVVGVITVTKPGSVKFTRLNS